MKKNIKRTLCTLLALVMVLGMTACGGSSGGDIKITVDVPEKYKEFVTPYNVDVVERAKKDGKMHYYFMASMGYVANAGDHNVIKWGDSCLIVFPDGTTMLIDAGVEGYGPILVLNLKLMGIEKLDYFVLTHPHDDHGYGAVRPGGLLENIEVGHVYYSGVLNAGWSNPTILPDLCQQKNIPCDIIKEGDKLNISGVDIQVLNPTADVAGTTIAGSDVDGSITKTNNASLVMRFDFEEHSALFTGDVYRGAESDLVKRYKESGLLDVDFLKLPHHGGDTSNSITFVKAITPVLGVATGNDPVDIMVYGNYKKSTTVLMDSEDGYVHVAAGSDGVMTYETSRVRSEKSTYGQLPEPKERKVIG